MATGIGAGLGATFGYAQESTVGTYTAPDHFVTFQKEAHELKKGIVQSQALHGGLYNLATRRAYTTHTVDGSIDMDVYDRGQGLLFKHMLGSVNVTTHTGYAVQVFTPGSTVGESLSFQIGKPQTNGTIVPFQYNGVKVTDWTISVAANQQAALSISTDAWNQTVTGTYTAPSYVASNMFHFAEAQLLVGGTVTSTGTGSAMVTTVTSATALATCKSVSIKGTNALATDRFFLNSAGTKGEQLPNGFYGITGQMEVEFENLTDLYNAFAADTNTAVQLIFTGPTIGTTSQSSQLSVIVPAMFFDTAPVEVAGPAILTQTASWTALDDGVNNPVQITYTTADMTP